MSTAMRHTKNALILEYEVSTGDTATEGEAVLLDSDTTIDDCDGASDLAVGIALKTGVAGDKVPVAMFGHAVIGAKAGTGGVTRGKKQILVSDGFTDAPAHDADGNTNDAIYGVALQSATAGQFFGLLVGSPSNRGSA